MRRTFSHVFAVFALSACAGCTCSAAADAWRSYALGIDGLHESGKHGGTRLLVRDGYLPVIASEGALPAEERLPDGVGALAGVCYFESSGGRLRDASGYLPMAGVVVEIVGGTRRFAVKTDGEGYFLVSLPAGRYTVRVAGFSYQVTIENGKSFLVALRGGKRMVD